MRGILLSLNFLLMMGLLTSCFEPEGQVEELDFAQESLGGMSKEAAFAATVHPLLVANCSSCHGDGGSQVKHSLSSASDAWQVVDSRAMISFDNPGGSNIVAKVRSGHNCWSNCDSNADALQTAVENMKNMVRTDGGRVFDRAASAEVFKTTVHPLLMGKCAGCHGDPGTQAPRHAVSDYKKAHDAVIDSARVDFANIPNSRLVKRLSEDGHYCWGDCADNAAEMKNLIEQWASKVDTTPLTGVDGFKTAALGIGQAEVRLPETINGTIMFQAEDGILEGRYKIKSDSAASGLLYVSGDRPVNHPIEGTGRGPSFVGPGGSTNLCRTVTPAQIANGTGGRYRESERRRHINQSGYRYYSQLIRGRFIRPQLREQFRQALVNGQSNLDVYFLASGTPDNPANPLSAPLGGNDYMRDIHRILPEFTSKSLYDSSIRNASEGSQWEDFFAPKYGSSGSEFYTADNSTIRANILDDARRRAVYDQVYDQFRDYFYDNNNLSDPQDNIYSIPFSLRKLPNGTSFTQNSQSSADAFMAEYFGGLTRANATDVVGTDPNGNPIKRIDTYIHYEIDSANRAFDNFTVNLRNSGGTDYSQSYSINLGDVELDLLNYFSGEGALDARSIRINNYGSLIKEPILAPNCAGCHGDGSGRPQFATNNDSSAYDAAGSINNFFNVSNPNQSRVAVRMFQERHNCGSAGSCDTIGNQFVSALEQWETKSLADIAAAQNNQSTGLTALSDQERTPGRAKYEFKVTEAGDYNVWLKVKTLTADSRDFRIRILDSQGRPIKNCAASQNCVPVESDYNGKSEADIDSIGCEAYDVGDHSQWTWYTESLNNSNNRRKWQLSEGNYTLEIIEAEADAKFDLVAISKNPDFNPLENLIDEGYISTRRPKILVYDLEPLIGQAGKFEIEVKEKESGDAYIFRNPRFVGASSNIQFRDIKLLMNNSYKFENSTYTKLDRIVNGADSGVLTSASLMALQVFGATTDSFAFVFKALAPSSEPAQAIEDDAPVPVEGRECQNLALFERTVMPILNNFKLMFKDDYLDYTSQDFPGSNARAATNPTIYNCTTCHNEDHPYFKMTTFFDDSATLCKQALSRVDFGNYEKSLLLRGLNGTFNHPKLNFIQKVNITGSGDSRGFQTSSTDPSGYASEFIGLRFEKWTASELGLNNPGQYSSAQQQYLYGHLNRYKRIKYQIYNDPFSVFDGEIITENDVFVNGELVEQRNGLNKYNVDSPLDHLGNLSAVNGPFKVKPNCVRQNFNTNAGLTTDPCNSNVDVSVEFEQIKQNYRDSIINWMNEEKKSYDAMYGN